MSPALPGPLGTRLADLHASLCADLFERDEEARVLLLAALAGEHVLLLGPPGTAKSELARRLRGCLADGAYFERLLTKFSVPEELFGPLSIKEPRAGRISAARRRLLTDGGRRLPGRGVQCQ